jgi:ABC-type polysaccharide/polyol phosphate transport system ATPase subunit
MKELCEEARTILIVSHALSSINELCDHVIWMHRGSMLASGEPEVITEQYLKYLNVGELPSSYEDL